MSLHAESTDARRRDSSHPVPGSARQRRGVNASALCAWLILLVPPVANAGLDLAVDASTTSPQAATRRPDASVLSARKGERREPTLRCFQEGRLVYEGSGLTPAARSTTPLDFRSTRSRQIAVQVLDLKSGLCLIENPDAP